MSINTRLARLSQAGGVLFDELLALTRGTCVGDHVDSLFVEGGLFPTFAMRWRGMH
jgi:hypothetical protein